MKNLQFQSPQRQSLERAALLTILLLGFALRVYRLGAQAIWWDESLSVYRATRDLGTILSNTILIQNVITVDTLPPLYFLLLHFIVSLAGISEFALRWLSVAANMATLALLYALARRWFPARLGGLVGLTAALLGALAPFYVWYAQEARPYALVLFWSTLAVYALTRAMGRGRGSMRMDADKNESLGSSLRYRWAVVYIVAAAAAIYTHYFGLFMIPFHVVLIAALAGRKHWKWLFLAAVPLATAVLLVPMVLASAAGNAGSGPYFVPLDVILRDVLNSFSVGITIDPAQAVWIDVALLALFIIGAVSSQSPTAWLIPSYVLVPVLGMFAVTFIRPLYQNSRYLIAISPAFYLGVAAGAAALANKWRVLAIPALAIFLAGTALSLDNLYFNTQFGKDEHRAWAEYLKEHARPGDFLILDSPHTEELYKYYTRTALPWASLPVLRADHIPSPEADTAAVRGAYKNHARVWFLTMNVPFDDPDARIEKLLNAEGALIDRVDVPGTSTEISLALFAPALPVVNIGEIAHPLNIAFAGHLILQGYDAPPSILAGTRGIATLFWTVDENVGEDYDLSLRLVDATGDRAAQWDDVILGNRAGTSTWKVGTILADTRDMPIAAGIAPGTYTIQVVPYHAATGSALGDVVTLGTIQVVNDGGAR